MNALTTEFFVTGGTLRRDAACYVVRQADHELHDGLKQGRFCYILTARQMGKSSLMVRTAARLREEGCGVVILDLTAIGQNLSAEQWYRGLLGQMGYQLELEDELIGFWRANKEIGAAQRWMRAIREVVLPRYPGPVVIFIDEIDAVRSLPFSTDEFFAAIREFYNRRTEDEELERLTFCLLGVATPSDLIRDTRTTPFNIGQRIELYDFTEAEAATLAPGLRREEKVAAALIERIHHWTNGHPYLTQRLCQAIVDTNPQSQRLNPQSVDHLCEQMFFSPRAQERDDNLLFVRERMLRSEVDLAGLLHIYERVQRGKRVRDDETNQLVSVLRLSGIVRVEDGRLRERNCIYARVFDREWVKTNMPDAEVRRQQAAFRRGLLRAAAVAAVIIAAIAALALFATRERNAAEQARAEALSRELAANAIVQLPQDPELSVLLAIEALRVAPTTQAEDALRQSLPESHVQAVMRGHTDAVSSAAFSPDGKWVVTASFDRTARVWDASTGRSVAELRGHTNWVYCATFSPDSRLVVTASKDDPVARVLEATTGQCLVQLRGHSGPVNWVGFSPDGRMIVTTSDDSTARVWEIGTGKELAVLRGHHGAVWGAAFSPDGQRIVTGGIDKTGRVWSTRDWQNVARLRGDTEIGGMVNFSPDGQLVATLSGDTVHMWNANTGFHLTELRGHIGKVVTAAFSPDSQLMVTGGYDGTARVWEARTGRGLKELRGHTSKVVSVAFSPNGRLALTSSWDGTSRIWEVSTGQTWKELHGHMSGRGLAGKAAFSPDGKWAVTSGGYEARVWVVIRDDVATELRGHTDQVMGATFSPNGKLVASASKDRTARIWDARTGFILKELRGHTDWIRSAEYSPDGKLLVTASADKTARVWEVDTGRGLQELRGHTNRVWSAAFSPDGRHVVTASEDGTAQIWEASAGRSIVELRGHTDRVDNAKFSPDGRFVVTASWDKTARIWEASTGRSLIVLRGHTDRVSGSAFSSDGKWVVTGSYDSAARVWEASTGRSVRELRGHKAYVTSVAFSPDGQFVVAASVDGTARVWETSTGQSVTRIHGHTDEVWSAAFSPDGKYIVTGSYDKTARIYACEVCRPIQDVLALARSRVTRGLTPEEREKYLHEPPRD
jgi:WD40 repeat protein